jgi:hypothetical protein
VSSELSVKHLPDIAASWLRLRALLPDARLHVVGRYPPPKVNRLNSAAHGWRHCEDAKARAFREDIETG